MRKIFIIITFVLLIPALRIFAMTNLLIDDFEGSISSGPIESVGTGANGSSTIKIAPDTTIKYSGKQSLKVTFDTSEKTGAAWVTRGYELEETPNSSWLVKPEEIAWEQYAAISFYIYGANSRSIIKLHIIDSDHEVLEYTLKDDFTGWNKLTCAFADFYTSPSWQSKNAKTNGQVDFPIKSFTFIFPLGQKGTLYFDHAELIAK